MVSGMARWDSCSFRVLRRGVACRTRVSSVGTTEHELFAVFRVRSRWRTWHPFLRSWAINSGVRSGQCRDFQSSGSALWCQTRETVAEDKSEPLSRNAKIMVRISGIANGQDS